MEGLNTTVAHLQSMITGLQCTCQEQSKAIDALSRLTVKQEKTITSLQATCTEQKKTIVKLECTTSSLQAICSEQEKTITKLGKTCRQTAPTPGLVPTPSKPNTTAAPATEGRPSENPHSYARITVPHPNRPEPPVRGHRNPSGAPNGGSRLNCQVDAQTPNTAQAVTNPPNSSQRPGRSKCLLIHDGTFNEFNESLFPRRYDVETLRCASLQQASRDSDAIVGKIKSIRPESIIVHAGYKDLHDGREQSEVTRDLEIFMGKLSKLAKSCISLPIVPQSHQHPGFVDMLNKFNSTVSDRITDLRRNRPADAFQLFTHHPGSLNKHAVIRDSQPGPVLLRSDVGKRMLFIKLRDCLDRMTGRLLPRNKNPPTSNDTKHGRS